MILQYFFYFFKILKFTFHNLCVNFFVHIFSFIFPPPCGSGDDTTALVQFCQCQGAIFGGFGALRYGLRGKELVQQVGQRS
jgi:hypothetical protein